MDFSEKEASNRTSVGYSQLSHMLFTDVQKISKYLAYKNICVGKITDMDSERAVLMESV